ncbi:MAG: hypothetical protein RMM53_09155 [Bacteroidia bacterium]|nr:hypothetical protein [Bacteroidia bacterium]MDW8334368.1 hypothetical protein [Bacteroidia bacterium]
MGKRVGETIHVGRRIKERVAQMPELTAKALASKMNMHEQTLYDVYRRSSVDTDKLLQFSEILKVPLSYFFMPYDDGKDNKAGSKPESSSAALPSTASSESFPVVKNEPTNTSTRTHALEAELSDLRRQVAELFAAFDEFREKTEIEIQQLRKQMSEIGAHKDNDEQKQIHLLWEQRLKELEALNQERAQLVQALLKRCL